MQGSWVGLKCIGNLEAINQENEVIEKIELTDVLSAAQKTMNKDNVSVIYYHPKS